MLTVNWTPSLPSLLWCLALTLVVVALWARVARLAEDYEHMSEQLERIAEHVSGIRHELGGVARAQQIDELRRNIAT